MGKQFLSLLHNFGAIYIEIDESLFNFSNQWNLRKSFATRRKDQPLLNKNKNSQFLERFDDHLTWKFFKWVDIWVSEMLLCLPKTPIVITWQCNKLLQV